MKNYHHNYHFISYVVTTVTSQDEKPERLVVEGGEFEKMQPRKRRDQLPKPSVAGEELGLRQLMAIVARRLPLPMSFFEPLTMLQVKLRQQKVYFMISNFN